MRAAAYDQEAALAQGVSVGAVFALSWAIAGALAAVGGTFVATGASVDQQLWIIALVALPVIILGGLDSLGGAVIGGLAVGVVESLVATYQPDLAPWLGGERRPRHAVRADADRAAGPPLRPVRHPRGGAGMTTMRTRSGRPALYTSYGRTWPCSTRGQEGVVGAAARAGAGHAGLGRRRPAAAARHGVRRRDRRDRAGPRHRLRRPGLAGPRVLPRPSARTPPRVSAATRTASCSASASRGAGLAAGRRAAGRLGRALVAPLAVRLRGLYLAIVTLGLVFIGRARLPRVDARSPAAPGSAAPRRSPTLFGDRLDVDGRVVDPRPEAVSG